MKQLFFILGMLVVWVSSFSQQPDDAQWLITEDGYQQGNSWVSPAPSLLNINITGMKYPNSSITDEHDVSNIARNDFFIIFDDGTHYNGRSYIPPHLAPTSHGSIPLNTPGFSPPEMMGYSIRNLTGRSIEYFYASNIYEEDDIEEFVTVNATTPWVQEPYLQPYEIPNSSSPPSTISANHDVVKEKDITLIFDLAKVVTHLKRQGLLATDLSGDFNLCFDVPQGESSTPFNSSEINFSPVFNNSPGYGFNSVGTFDNGCITGMRFDISKPFAYLNLIMPLSIGLHKDEQMKFVLSTNNLDENIVHPETIRDSHDPNFVEVMCVSEKCGFNIVKYHIECENEDPTLAGNVTFNLTLPYDFTDVEIMSSMIEDEVNVLTEPPEIINRTIKFDFELNSLGQDQKAYVEFCVKYNDVDVQTTNLQPDYPYTTFDNTVYAIEEFRDITEILPPSVTEDGDAVYYTYLLEERELSPNCSCNYRCCTWPWCRLQEWIEAKKIKQPKVQSL